MKIIHFMFTAVIAAVFASCDEHMDFPDTAMKIGDIVCTDGAIVRYEDVDSLKKDTYCRCLLRQPQRGCGRKRLRGIS